MLKLARSAGWPPIRGQLTSQPLIPLDENDPRYPQKRLRVSLMRKRLRVSLMIMRNKMQSASPSMTRKNVITW